MFWVLLNSVVVISAIGKACKFLLSFCNFLFFNRSKKMESMKKLDHKRPFFFKTHARKFLGILACSQTIYFFFRHRCTESHFSLLDFYLRLSGFQALLQVIHFLYSGVQYPWYCAQVWHWTYPMWRFITFRARWGAVSVYMIAGRGQLYLKPENIRQQQSFNSVTYGYIFKLRKNVRERI